MALTPEQLAEIQRLKALMQPLATEAQRKAQAVWNAEQIANRNQPPGKADGGNVDLDQMRYALTMNKEKFGFEPTQEWLDHLRLSSVRLNDGGSGSFVSSKGLLLTNHHVARGQLQVPGPRRRATRCAPRNS